MPALPCEIDVFHQPSNTNYLARIVKLSRRLVASGMGDAWWKDPDVTLPQDDPPVDLAWPWVEAVTESEAETFPATTHFVAVVTDDDAVQGAMMVDGAAVLAQEPQTCSQSILKVSRRRREPARTQGG